MAKVKAKKAQKTKAPIGAPEVLPDQVGEIDGKEILEDATAPSTNTSENEAVVWDASATKVVCQRILDAIGSATVSHSREGVVRYLPDSQCKSIESQLARLINL